MPYITDRIVHDADAHIFEPPGWFEPRIDPALRAQLARFTGERDVRVEKIVRYRPRLFRKNLSLIIESSQIDIERFRSLW